MFKMRSTLAFTYLALAYLSITQAAVYHRADKISEEFKQLDLAPEEIDPDVAPPNPNKVEQFEESTDEALTDNVENEIPYDVYEQSIAENEIADESVNDIVQPVATAATVAVTTIAPAVTEAVTPVKEEEEETSGLAKYCKCTGNYCDCCRQFNVPFTPVKGPACAKMTYLGNEKMSISLKYGDLTLATRTVSSKRARPICIGLPGGYSQFCGRIYGLSKAKENFKACLGFELRADDEVEAALRVSCFKFGAKGLKVAEAEPFPVQNDKEDDDDDGIFGFGAGGDEEDEDDYDEGDDEDEEEETEEDPDADYADDDDDVPADPDYGGFSLVSFLEALDDDEDDDAKPSATPAITSPATSATATPATRAEIDPAQSKDDTGIVAAKESIEANVPTLSPTTDQVTSVPQSNPTSTANSKKSKKTTKNKRKKADDTEGSLAYEFLNGLLYMFN